MAELFKERVEAFQGLLRSVNKLVEPTETEKYEKKLRIKTDMENEQMFSADNLLKKMKMQAIVAEAGYTQKEDFEKRAYLAKREYTQAEGLEETELNAATALRAGKKFDRYGGVLNARKLEPGQKMRAFRVFKKFDATSLLDISNQRIASINLELDNWKKQIDSGQTGGVRKAALLEEIRDLDTDLNKTYVKDKIARWGDTSQINAYNAYVKNLETAKKLLGME